MKGFVRDWGHRFQGAGVGSKFSAYVHHCYSIMRRDWCEEVTERVVSSPGFAQVFFKFLGG